MSQPGLSDEDAFGPRPQNGGQLAPHADDTVHPTAVSGTSISDEEAFGPRGSEAKPMGFLRGAADLGAAAWADFNRHTDPNNNGSSTPALDHYFKDTPAGQMLKQFGQDVTAPISQLPSLSTIDDGKGVDFLKRTGDYDAWQKNHAATSEYFRNSAMRPSAVSAVGETQAMGRVLGAGVDIAKTYGSGILDAANQLRRDIIGDKDDLSQLQGRAFEAKILPYIHSALQSMPITPLTPGLTADKAMDALMLAGTFTGIPQLIGTSVDKFVHGVDNALTAVLGPIPGDTPQKRAARIQDGIDKLNFAAMFVGPEGSPMSASLNISRRLDQARRGGVIGQPPVFTDTAMDIKAQTKREQAQQKAIGQEPSVTRPVGMPEPDLQPSPPSVEATPPPVETPARDVHGVAREMAPELFNQYDPLAARHAWYTDWVNELRAARDNDPRLQRAQEEIDGILAKVGGIEDRLTNRARNQIADIRGGMQDFLATDTPDMFVVKQALLENYQQMAPLQPQIQAAYRSAVERMASEAADRGEQAPIQTAPVPPPEPDVVNLADISRTGEKTPQETAILPPVIPRPELPAETAHIQTTQDIATDISRQLQAAGKPKEEADAWGVIAASHYESRARRLGGAVGTGADLYRLEGPVIQGSRRAGRGQRTFAQTANDLEDAVSGNFYSALTRGVEAVQQNKAPATQWAGIIDNLRGKGVRQEEIDWSGVKNWLAEQEGPVTKAALLEHLRENEVKVEEVLKGRVLRTVPNPEETAHAGEPMFDVVDDTGRVFYTGGAPDAAEYIKEGPGGPKTTKFEAHILPGGQNYRELLLTLPEKSGGERGPKGWGDTHGGTLDTANFRSSHFEEPNILAHVRFDNRTGPNGEKVLHVAEIQSDWHQQGRRRGYVGSDVPGVINTLPAGYKVEKTERVDGPVFYVVGPEGKRVTAYSYNQQSAANEFINMYNDKMRRLAGRVGSPVLNAPFKTSWQELAVKRMLRYAAENGYDRLSWDTGETQVDRYDLSHHLDRIEYEPTEDGNYEVHAYDKTNHRVINEDEIGLDRVEELLGKDIAKKIEAKEGEKINSPYRDWRALKGLDLKVGGEGMKGFYDKILPDFVNKYAKKWGVKVEDTQINNEPSGFVQRRYNGPDLSVKEVKAKLGTPEAGALPVSIRYQVHKAIDLMIDGHPINSREVSEHLSDRAAEFLGGKMVDEPTTPVGDKVHSIPITPAMRESVLEGQPLFQPNRGAITFRKGMAPIIRMMADSDPSTIVHESGHAWLEELMRDAAHPNAPVDLQADAATTRAWLGIKAGEPIPRRAHEQWARGFERYLMEGIAPTRELATVFGKFKQWLTRIYQAVTKLRSPINDDIRRVFDHLIAAPDQPTIIAEPRNTARMMADMHEVEASTTPAHMAGPAADQIDHEVETQLRRVAPEEHDALLRSELEGGAVQKPGGASEGRVHETKPLAGPTSGNATATPLAAGEHELAPASSQLRATAVKAGAGDGAAAGEPGPAVESVEQRIARRLAGGADRQGLGGRGGLETPGTGMQVPSQLGLNVQARAIAAGMPDETVGEVLQHAQLSKAEQSDLAAHFLATDPMGARAVALSQRPPPKGLMQIFVYKAVEKQAIANRDWATINALSQSKVLDSVTDAGRILNALNDQDPISPTAVMRSVNKAREKNATTLAQRGLPTQLTPAEQQLVMDATARAQAAQDDWVAHGQSYDDTARRRAAARAQMEVVRIQESLKPGQPFWSWNTLWNVAAIPKSLLTNFPHLSAPMVQGWGMITTDRGFFGIGEMLKYMASEENYLNNHADIISHPDYWMVDDGGLALTKLGDELSKREEAIQSSLVEQANQWLTDHTGLPNFTHIASRAFTGYLNFVRANRFYDLIAAARARGEDLSAGSRVIKDIAKVVNDFTGRGALGVGDKYGNTSQALNTAFFAPRKISATINMFNPERYLNPNISPTARIAATRQMFGSLAATSALIGLASAMGAGVDLDPTSNDFAKIIIGDEKFDLSGGNATYLKMLYRLITGWKKNAAGNYVDLTSGKPFQETRADLLISFFRNKLAPTAGAFADALWGKDPAGRPFNISDELMDKLVPITMGDVIHFAAYDHDNYAALLPMVSILFGVQMESPQAPKDMMGMNVWGQPTGYYSQPLREPVDQELKQVGYSMGFPQPAIQGVKLNDDQYKAYIQIAGDLSRQSIENDMSLPGWSDYPKEEKLRLIRSDVAAGRRNAADQLMSDDLTTSTPGESLMDQATKLKNRQYGIDQ